MQNKAYKIITPRLQLRCYEHNDAEKLKKSVDESLSHIRDWLPWAKHEPQSIKQKSDLIINFREKFLNNEDYTYGIFDLHNKKLIGGTGLHNRSSAGILEIGYWINVNEIGNGYAQEAAYAMALVGFEVIEVDKLEIRCDYENFRSANIPPKLNFKHEYDFRVIEKNKLGERKKHQVFVMFKEEFMRIKKYDPITMYNIYGDVCLQIA